MIRIFLIEDEAIFALGLKSVYRSRACNIELLGFTNKISVALQLIQELQPDVIILDLFLRREDPIENFRRVRVSFPQIPIIILTSEDSLLWKWRMMLEGAKGYVTKATEISELTDRIYRIKDGETLPHPDLDVFLFQLNKPEGLNIIRIFDLDLIRHRYHGLSYKEISLITGKTSKAIEKRLYNLCKLFNKVSVEEVIRLFYGIPLLYSNRKDLDTYHLV